MVKKVHSFEGFEWYALMATFKGFGLSQFWTITGQNDEKGSFYEGFDQYAQMATFKSDMRLKMMKKDSFFGGFRPNGHCQEWYA